MDFFLKKKKKHFLDKLAVSRLKNPSGLMHTFKERDKSRLNAREDGLEKFTNYLVKADDLQYQGTALTPSHFHACQVIRDKENVAL